MEASESACAEAIIMRIGIIGPIPPPYGGRTVHVQRLVDFISTHRKTWKVLIFDMTGNKQIKLSENVTVVPIRRRKDLLRLLFDVDIIHYHEEDWLLRALVGFLTFFGKKVVVSIHSNFFLKNEYVTGNHLKRMLIRLSLRRTSLIIATNREIKQFVMSLGICKNVVVIPSFIAPVKEKNITMRFLNMCGIS